VGARHGLFDIDRLARAQGADGIFGMGVGRRGDIDGVDLRIGDEPVGVSVPARHLVAAGVILRQSGRAAHDRRQSRMGNQLQGRSALDLGDLPAADDAPGDL